MKQHLAAVHAQRVADLSGKQTYILKTRNGRYVWYYLEARTPRKDERVEVFSPVRH